MITEAIKALNDIEQAFDAVGNNRCLALVATLRVALLSAFAEAEARADTAEAEIDQLEYLALARAQNATDRNDAKSAGAAARAALKEEKTGQ